MTLFLSLISWLNQRQITSYQVLSTENPTILTSMYSGIVTVIWLLSIVSSVPLPTGQKQFVLVQSFLIRKLQHLREALSKCKYPRWAIDKVQSKFLNSNWKEDNTQEGTTKQGTDSTSGKTTDRPPQGQTQQRMHSHSIHPRLRRKY